MGRLDFFLHPKSVAVIGASAIVGKVGNAVMKNIVESGFKGPVYPINPRRGQIFKYPVYQSVLDVEGDIDVAVVCIPAQSVLGVAKECGQKGVKGIVVIASGFKEVSNGAILEETLAEICRQYGLRCIGPNVLGNITPTVNMSFSPTHPLHGKIAMLSQSGAMMTAVLDWALTKRMGFSHFISLGNKMDVDEVDMIEEIVDDPGTSMIMLYLESVKKGDKFMKIVPEATRKKPIVVLKGGRSEEGQRAASSHTGAMAGNTLGFDLACYKTGVMEAATMKELFDLAIMFDKTSTCPPGGDSFVIVTNAGGPGILATDAFDTYNLSLTVLTEEAVRGLRGVLPAEASFRNPVDILGDATPERFRNALDILFSQDISVCAGAVVLITPQSTTNPLGVAELLVDVHDRFPDHLIVTVLMGGETMAGARDILEGREMPCYEFPEAAISSLSKVVLRNRRLSESREKEFPPRYKVDDAQIEAIITHARMDNRKVLLSDECAQIFNMFELPKPCSQVITTRDELDRIEQFPVAMKILSPDITHKTDVGGVRLGINSIEGAKVAFDEIMESVRTKGPTNARIVGVEVQAMVDKSRKGVEIITGAVRDPHWGPLIMVGTGGVYANYLKDVSWDLGWNYSRTDALAQLQKTKVYLLLQGVRGGKECDINAVIEVMLKIAQLMNDHPSIAELDINPLIAFEDMGDGQPTLSAVDVKITLGETHGTSAFLEFTKANKEELMREHPDWKVTDVSNELKKRWSNMSVEDKKRYETIAKEKN